MNKVIRLTLTGVLLAAIFLSISCSTPETESVTEQAASTAEVTEETKKEPSLTDEWAEIVEPIDQLVIPQAQIIALGEATHGNREFTELKLEVFEKLLAQGVRGFAIEGDFGGCYQVDQYIQTGAGNPEEIVKEIGFAIYNTREMTDLIIQLYEINRGLAEDDKIHFYGYDMQRYNNNKKILFEYIGQVDSQKLTEYEGMLADLSDETSLDQDAEKISQGQEYCQLIIDQMIENKDRYIAEGSELSYEIALLSARSIEAYANLQQSNRNYGQLRDQYMADWVTGILAIEQTYFQNDSIFIAGHNGHIDKASSMAGQDSMGSYLKEMYGEQYFVILTDFYEGSFLANDELTDQRKEFSISNEGRGRLVDYFYNTGNSKGAVWVSDESYSAEMRQLFSKSQKITTIGDAFSDLYQKMEAFYVLRMVPENSFDLLICFQEVTPVTMLD